MFPDFSKMADAAKQLDERVSAIEQSLARIESAVVRVESATTRGDMYRMPSVTSGCSGASGDYHG